MSEWRSTPKRLQLRPKQVPASVTGRDEGSSQTLPSRALQSISIGRRPPRSEVSASRVRSVGCVGGVGCVRSVSGVPSASCVLSELRPVASASRPGSQEPRSVLQSTLKGARRVAAAVKLQRMQQRLAGLASVEPNGVALMVRGVDVASELRQWRRSVLRAGRVVRAVSMASRGLRNSAGVSVEFQSVASRGVQVVASVESVASQASVVSRASSTDWRSVSDVARSVLMRIERTVEASAELRKLEPERLH